MISLCFELGINALQCYIIIAFLSEFFGFKLAGIKKYLGLFLCWLVAFAELTYVNTITPFEGIAILIPIAIYFGYARLCLKGDALLQLFMSSFILAFIPIIAVILNLAIGLLRGIDDPLLIITEFSIKRVVYVLTANIIFWGITRVLLRINKYTFKELKDWVLIISIPVLSIVGISFLMEGITQGGYDIQLNTLYAAIVILTTNVIAIFLFMRIGKDRQMEIEYNLLQQRNKSDLDLKSLYDNIKSLHHEMKHHLSTLAVLMSDNRRNDAINYINKINNQLDMTQKFIFTDNDIFNAIISAKLAICHKEGLYVEINVNNSLSVLSGEDISALFGDLFDNAIEASKNSARKRIALTIQMQNEHYISIFIRNSIDKSVLKENPALHTTKHNGLWHGYGVKKIRRIVEKYYGLIDFIEQDGDFCCDILIENTASNLPSTY